MKILAKHNTKKFDLINVFQYRFRYFLEAVIAGACHLLLSVCQRRYQFVIFKPLSYCFKETIEFDVKTSFASRP